jgi:hypothetical protein
LFLILLLFGADEQHPRANGALPTDDSVLSRMRLPRNLTISRDGNQIFVEPESAWPSIYNWCFTTVGDRPGVKHPIEEIIIKTSSGGNIQ